jgi:hypothetical protein
MTDSAQPEGRRECWFGPCEHGSYCERHDHHSVTDPFGQSFGHVARSTPAEALDVSEMAALHELERDLAAAEVEHMGDVWQRLRAILDGPQQRALAARLSPHNREAGE